MAGMALVVAVLVSLVMVVAGSYRAAQGYTTWGERLQAGIAATMIIVGLYASVLVMAIVALVVFTDQGCGVTATGPCDIADFAGSAISAVLYEVPLSIALGVASVIRERCRGRTAGV